MAGFHGPGMCCEFWGSQHFCQRPSARRSVSTDLVHRRGHPMAGPRIRPINCSNTRHYSFCSLEFLPPSAPDSNPVEHMWSNSATTGPALDTSSNGRRPSGRGRFRSSLLRGPVPYLTATANCDYRNKRSVPRATPFSLLTGAIVPRREPAVSRRLGPSGWASETRPPRKCGPVKLLASASG
jgi:hypothetical protein